MQNPNFEVDAIKRAIELSDLAKGVFNHPPKQQQCPTRQPWRQFVTPAVATPEAK